MKVYCSTCGCEIKEEDVLGVGTFDGNIGKYAGNTFVSFTCPQCHKKKYQFVNENPFQKDRDPHVRIHPELNTDELVLSKRAALIDCNDIIDFHRELSHISSVDDFLQSCVKEKESDSSQVGLTITQPVDVYHLFSRLNGLQKKRLLVCLLNRKNQVVAWEFMGEGMSRPISYSPQEIFRTALLLEEEVNIILAQFQNGPLSPPTKKDVLRAKRLVKSGRILGIEILDFILIHREGFKSLEQMDLF